MALTVETLKNETTLSGLTDAQYTAIAALSASDEDTVIGTKIGEIHGLYEQDIHTITGVKKNEGEKAYDYNKRILSTYKNNLDTLANDLNALKVEKQALQDKIASGSTDEALKTQLAQVNQALKDAQAAIQAKDTLLTTKEEEHKSRLLALKVESAFSQQPVKFKAAYSDTIASTLLKQAKAEIMEKYTPDFVKDANGNETLVFRDKTTNEIVRNPNNAQNPYTVIELYQTTVIKDAIDLGKKQGGAGSKSFEGKDKSPVDITNLDAAKTQKEADDLIYNHLMSKGLTRGSREFADEQKKIREEHGVAKLPIR